MFFPSSFPLSLTDILSYILWDSRHLSCWCFWPPWGAWISAVAVQSLSHVWLTHGLQHARLPCLSPSPGAGSKFRLKLENVGKTTRPFRYDLNKIPYDYTVEVRNRFKGLDLIESLMNYGQRFVTLYRRQGSRPSPWKRNAKRQNGCLRRPYK